MYSQMGSWDSFAKITKPGYMDYKILLLKRLYTLMSDYSATMLAQSWDFPPTCLTILYRTRSCYVSSW